MSGRPRPDLETPHPLTMLKQLLASGGTPAIVFGPGNIAQAHTADEWLDLKQLDQAVAIVTRFLRAQP